MTKSKRPVTREAGGVFSVPLTRGLRTLVSPGDAEWLGQYNWCAHGDRHLYAGRRAGEDIVLMHREIWEHHHGPIPKGVQIDHIDGNSLNNRVENLRLATNAENSRNRKLQPNNSSGAAGVRKRSSGRWDARIGSSSHGTMKYIGSFTTKAEAIAARMEVEAQMFGQFTRSNP